MVPTYDLFEERADEIGRHLVHRMADVEGELGLSDVSLNFVGAYANLFFRSPHDASKVSHRLKLSYLAGISEIPDAEVVPVFCEEPGTVRATERTMDDVLIEVEIRAGQSRVRLDATHLRQGDRVMSGDDGEALQVAVNVLGELVG